MNKKEMILAQIEVVLKDKKQALQAEIVAVQTSANSETKSSAGDKYETSRAMAQIEIDRLKTNLLVVEAQIETLAKIKTTKPMEKASFGALVSTNQDSFLLGIGLGKVKTTFGDIYAVSMESPLGQQIKAKRVLDSFMLAKNSCAIISIE